MYFLLNLSHCVKHYGHFVKFWLFYHVHLPNMVMSRDPRCKFPKYFIYPNSAFNIKKSDKISAVKALFFRSYQPKTSLGGGTPPVPLGLIIMLNVTYVL